MSVKTTIWYKVSSTHDEPEAVNVIKETKAYITVAKKDTFDGDYTMRAAKKSSYENYFEDEAEAWDWLLTRASKKVNAARENLAWVERADRKIVALYRRSACISQRMGMEQ